ncbi:MAG: putative enzyme related to lactoylglutathione lyase [Cellvibrionaceae bacterium]|jgi:predicted enzyme related to lactoylglutathione lyase
MSEKKNPKVRAIGGVFFRSENPEETRNWYANHLGLTVDAYGSNFAWRHKDEPEKLGHTQWSPFEADTDYFGKPEQQYMINYRVDDLEALVETLRSEGVKIVGEMVQESFGKFIHIIDNEGRRVELWEPVEDEYEKIVDGVTK